MSFGIILVRLQHVCVKVFIISCYMNDICKLIKVVNPTTKLCLAHLNPFQTLVTVV